ncbi:TIGR03084 family metal-binding protein [Dactylosporangium sp. AC04546]|uniref:TIGR03084 family metal-binding protein n=1 Tax=Dactylosporangium sp. AC04546 TaxID=2862460 RepID=UPI001EE1154D|nr:TIGR03084 family metal-binding protein [Dactylosporangium sp. AC04546]WVK84445.1 TIGR03084 family metal-binding protein [Dactylosporangium sp. AC04546]
MATLPEVLADLEAESAALDRLVSALPVEDWSRPTPAPGWTIAHQISHLHWTDSVAALAATDPAGFIAKLSEVDDPYRLVDQTAAEGVAPPAELLAKWRAGRVALIKALSNVPEKEKLPWFGVAMSPLSSATGRMMETWAHGRDIAETIGADEHLRPTDRLRHVVFLGYRTIAHSFVMHGRAEPRQPFRVELSTAGGDLWTFGPEDAPNRVTGPVLDFCLLVTQRRHPADLALQVTGDEAREWTTVAQAFAGPPGAKREPKR